MTWINKSFSSFMCNFGTLQRSTLIFDSLNDSLQFFALTIRFTQPRLAPSRASRLLLHVWSQFHFFLSIIPYMLGGKNRNDLGREYHRCTFSLWKINCFGTTWTTKFSATTTGEYCEWIELISARRLAYYEELCLALSNSSHEFGPGFLIALGMQLKSCRYVLRT